LIAILASSYFPPACQANQESLSVFQEEQLSRQNYANATQRQIFRQFVLFNQGSQHKEYAIKKSYRLSVSADHRGA
jgi:hypothetical protein